MDKYVTGLQPILIDSRADLTLAAYQAVAWDARGIELSERSKAVMRDCRAQFLRLLDDPDLVIYGVTTGYGQMAKKRLSPEERKAQAASPPFAVATSFGQPLPERVVRGIVFARLANFVDGHGAVSPELASAVGEMLHGSMPEVSSEGVGCAGEIQPLGQLFLDLCQKRTLGEKEALALINGSPVAASLLTDSVLSARKRLHLAEALFALSCEAILAPLEAYDPSLQDLWGDRCEAEALKALANYLEGAAEKSERRPYQAPVSWRILPRILGQARRALAQAEEAAQISLSAVSDNPVFLRGDDENPNGRVISTGGYHNAMAAPALDALASSWADLALLADRQTAKLLDGAVSRLPDNLLFENTFWPRSGYMGCLAMTAASWSEAARKAAGPSLLLASEGGGFGQNDVAPANLFAWRQEREAARAFEGVLSCLAGVASQALHVTGRTSPPALAELLETLRETIPPLENQRVLGTEAGSLADRFAAFAEPRGDDGINKALAKANRDQGI